MSVKFLSWHDSAVDEVNQWELPTTCISVSQPITHDNISDATESLNTGKSIVCDKTAHRRKYSIFIFNKARWNDSAGHQQ